LTSPYRRKINGPEAQLPESSELTAMLRIAGLR